MASSSFVDQTRNISADDILQRDLLCVVCPLPVEPATATDSVSGVMATSTQDRTRATSGTLSSLSPSIFTASTTETSTIPPSTSSTHTSNARPPLGPGPVKLPTITPASGKTSVQTPGAAPAFTSTSRSASSSRSETEVFSSPEVTSHALANRPITSSSLQASSNATFSPQSQVPTVTSSSPSHRVFRSIPTPALAGAIAFVILATATAILLSVWLRRRRARARQLLPAQNDTSGLSASDHSPSATVPVVHPRLHVFSKVQADDSVPETCTPTTSLVSKSSHDARDGSATSQKPSTSSRTLPAIHAEHEDYEYHGKELRRSSRPLPDPPSTEYTSDRSESLSGMLVVSQDNATAAPELVTAGTQDERLLHLALPWAFAQRVLAMRAGEDRDAQSVGSEGSEPLPAYEPRR